MLHSEHAKGPKCAFIHFLLPLLRKSCFCARAEETFRHAQLGVSCPSIVRVSGLRFQQAASNHESDSRKKGGLRKDGPMAMATRKRKSDNATSDKPTSTDAPDQTTQPEGTVTKTGKPRGGRKTIEQTWMQTPFRQWDTGLGTLAIWVARSPRDFENCDVLRGSLRKLGRDIGVTANAVLRWEKDEVTPTRSKCLNYPVILRWNRLAGMGYRRATQPTKTRRPCLATRKVRRTAASRDQCLVGGFDQHGGRAAPVSCDKASGR